MRDLIQRLRQTYDDFQATLSEGNYRTQRSFIDVLTGQSHNLPSTTEVAVGATMLGTSKSFSKKLLWASAIALISMEAMAWVAVGIGLAGLGLFGLEYRRAQKTRNDIITEFNFAGQRVEGRRGDLYRLHVAQMKIMNLGESFNEAAMASTHDAVDSIVSRVEKERGRVQVLDGGRYGAGTDIYEFSEPGIKLVNPRITIAVEHQAPKPDGLKEAFDGKAAYSEDEIVDRMVALQKALPPQILEKVNERLRSGKGPPN